MLRLVLFDIDGTLIHSGGAGEKAFAKVCAMEFKIPNGTAHLRFAGRTDTGIVREFFVRHQIEPSRDNFRRFFDCYVFWLDQILARSHTEVCPGVWELLRELRASRLRSRSISMESSSASSRSPAFPIVNTPN